MACHERAGAPSRFSGFAPGAAYGRAVAYVFDAKRGDVVLGSGLSPGEVPGIPQTGVQANRAAGNLARDLIAAREAPTVTERVSIPSGEYDASMW